MSSYPYLLVPFLTWFVAQSLKFLINALNGKVNFGYFYNSGGMPSAHSATVASLTTVAAKLEGLESALFGVTAVFAAVVLYDSLGVRRSSGDHSIALNAIHKFLGRDKKFQPAPIREILGHEPLEVAAGVILGIISALVLLNFF